MSSFPRLVRRGKKTKRLGEAKVIRKEDVETLELDTRIELIRALIPLGLAEIYSVLDEEVLELAGERYERKGGHRHGTNPGSVRLGGPAGADSGTAGPGGGWGDPAGVVPHPTYRKTRS